MSRPGPGRRKRPLWPVPSTKRTPGQTSKAPHDRDQTGQVQRPLLAMSGNKPEHVRASTSSGGPSSEGLEAPSGRRPTTPCFSSLQTEAAGFTTAVTDPGSVDRVGKPPGPAGTATGPRSDRALRAPPCIRSVPGPRKGQWTRPVLAVPRTDALTCPGSVHEAKNSDRSSNKKGPRSKHPVFPVATCVRRAYTRVRSERHRVVRFRAAGSPAPHSLQGGTSMASPGASHQSPEAGIGTRLAGRDPRSEGRIDRSESA